MTRGIILGTLQETFTLNVEFLLRNLMERQIHCKIIPQFHSKWALSKVKDFINTFKISHLIIGTPDRSEIHAIMRKAFPMLLLEVIYLPEPQKDATPDEIGAYLKKSLQLLLAEHAAINFKTNILIPEYSPVQAVLIIGGGIAGIEAALLLSRYFSIYLIEKQDQLGGNLNRKKVMIPYSGEIQNLLQDRLEQVSINDKIHVLLNTKIIDVSGIPGNFLHSIGLCIETDYSLRKMVRKHISFMFDGKIRIE